MAASASAQSELRVWVGLSSRPPPGLLQASSGTSRPPGLPFSEAPLALADLEDISDNVSSSEASLAAHTAAAPVAGCMFLGGVGDGSLTYP